MFISKVKGCLGDVLWHLECFLVDICLPWAVFLGTCWLLWRGCLIVGPHVATRIAGIGALLAVVYDIVGYDIRYQGIQSWMRDCWGNSWYWIIHRWTVTGVLLLIASYWLEGGLLAAAAGLLVGNIIYRLCNPVCAPHVP